MLTKPAPLSVVILVNADLMRLRAFGPAVHGFLDTIRDGLPTHRFRRFLRYTARYMNNAWV
ncbi:MAG: hypothetical protein CMH13_22420 [Martelella sp.]|nr:hypothetical protein [Martelella sp.]